MNATLEKKTPVLGLNDYHMSHEEIGKVLGISRQRVNTIQKRALEKIRNYVQESGRGEYLLWLLESMENDPAKTL